MSENTTVSVMTLGTAIATIVVTVLALCGVNLGTDETAAALTGSAATIFAAVLGFVLPR